MPYQTVFGRAPPTLLDYIAGATSVAAIKDLLSDRSLILCTLKENLQKAQLRMNIQADSKCTDVSFNIGDWVFLPL